MYGEAKAQVSLDYEKLTAEICEKLFSLNPHQHAEAFKTIKLQTKERLLQESDRLSKNGADLSQFVKEYMQ